MQSIKSYTLSKGDLKLDSELLVAKLKMGDKSFTRSTLSKM